MAKITGTVKGTKIKFIAKVKINIRAYAEDMEKRLKKIASGKEVTVIVEK